MKQSELEFVKRMRDVVNMSQVRTRDDLYAILSKKLPTQSTKGLIKQVDILAEYHGIGGKPIVSPQAPTKVVSNKTYYTERKVLRVKSKPEPAVYNTVTVSVKGFKKKQIRDADTGKILGWVESNE